MLSSLITKKFSEFETYMRSNLVVKTKASAFYKHISEAEETAFMKYYLKILLEKLEDYKKKAEPDVPETDRKTPRFGYRTAPPIPKGGVSAIKPGKMPVFNLEVMINDTLEKAIQDYLETTTINPDVIKAFNDAESLTVVSLEDLMTIQNELGSVYERKQPLTVPFRIESYLTEHNARFINSAIRNNIKNFHDNCTTKIMKMSCYEEGHYKLGIRNAILPVGTGSDIVDRNYLPAFQSGNGVEFILYVLDNSEAYNFESITKYTNDFKVCFEDIKNKFEEDYSLELENKAIVDGIETNLGKDTFIEVKAIYDDLKEKVHPASKDEEAYTEDDYFNDNPSNKIAAENFKNTFFKTLEILKDTDRFSIDSSEAEKIKDLAALSWNITNCVYTYSEFTHIFEYYRDFFISEVFDVGDNDIPTGIKEEYKIIGTNADGFCVVYNSIIENLKNNGVSPKGNTCEEVSSIKAETTNLESKVPNTVFETANISPISDFNLNLSGTFEEQNSAISDCMENISNAALYCEDIAKELENKVNYDFNFFISNVRSTLGENWQIIEDSVAETFICTAPNP